MEGGGHVFIAECTGSYCRHSFLVRTCVAAAAGHCRKQLSPRIAWVREVFRVIHMHAHTHTYIHTPLAAHNTAVCSTLLQHPSDIGIKSISSSFPQKYNCRLRQYPKWNLAPAPAPLRPCCCRLKLRPSSNMQSPSSNMQSPYSYSMPSASHTQPWCIYTCRVPPIK